MAGVGGVVHGEGQEGQDLVEGLLVLSRKAVLERRFIWLCFEVPSVGDQDR